MQDAFDADVPNMVFERREKRRLEKDIHDQLAFQVRPNTTVAAKQSAFNFGNAATKPSNMYYCIQVNCTYKPQILELL